MQDGRHLGTARSLCLAALVHSVQGDQRELNDRLLRELLQLAKQHPHLELIVCQLLGELLHKVSERMQSTIRADVSNDESSCLEKGAVWIGTAGSHIRSRLTGRALAS